MTIQWILILIYTIGGAILMIANSTLFFTPVEVNFLFWKANIVIYPLFYLITLFFLVLLGLIGIIKEEQCQKKINKFKAEMYDSQTEELKTLTSKLEAYLTEFMDEIDKRLHTIEQKLGEEEGEEKKSTEE
ncbi:MAG: hypothetical protein DRQ03_01575 [Candidatus Hydrothermota bacterium]|nr:MAG: hypothetical protein DRQ03_01575 [Candidatus Hydrothermae bacterium]